MISKMPRWIWIGAPGLAFVAGTVNAVGFLGLAHQGISHLTGTTTLFGIALARHDFTEALHLLTVILAFVLGAALSGFIIQDSTLRLGRRYGVALLLESLILLVALFFLRKQNVVGDYFASTACGLQNAMVSTYSGATLRTTHVSGVLTDVGIFFGHLIRRLPVDWRRFRLWLVLAGAFSLGGFAGGLLFFRFSYDTLIFPAALTGLAGVAYSVYHHRLKAEHRQPH